MAKVKKITREDLKKLSIDIGPISKLIICNTFKMEVPDYDEWRAKSEGSLVLKTLDQLILNSFYKWGMNPKIKSSKAIELYVENEIPKSQTGIKLEVINDINDFQKQVQPFNINNEMIDIQNPRDNVTIIPDEELLDFIEEDADA